MARDWEPQCFVLNRKTRSNQGSVTSVSSCSIRLIMDVALASLGADVLLRGALLPVFRQARFRFPQDFQDGLAVCGGQMGIHVGFFFAAGQHIK